MRPPSVKEIKASFTIVEIAELAGVDPKIARKRLLGHWRRRGTPAPHAKWQRWRFPAADVSQVISIIDPPCCAGSRWHKPLTPL